MRWSDTQASSSSVLSSSAYPYLDVYRFHSPSEPERTFKLNRATKDVLFGSIAGMVAKVFEHPFDLVKVRLQTQSADRPVMYTGAWDCFRQTFVKEGARGLFRGLSMPIFGATLENATLFVTYNYVQGKLREINGTNSPSSSSSSSTSSLEADAEQPLSMGLLSIAAAAAGSATSFVLTPVELIKCKMQVQMVSREMDILASRVSQPSTLSSAAAASASASPRDGIAAARATSSSAMSSASSATRTLSTRAFADLDGPVKIFMETLKREGPTGLWLGQTGTLLRETGGGIAWFLGFEWACRTMIEGIKKKQILKSEVTKKDLSSLQLMGAGALAGVSYNVVLFPADSVKSTMQTDRELSRGKPYSDGSPWKKSGFFETFAKIYKTKGVRGLYAGCAVTCMRSAPSSALIFLLYNRLEGLADDYGI